MPKVKLAPGLWGSLILLRHPAWRRAQETYGEDPHHLGEVGAAGWWNRAVIPCSSAPRRAPAIC